MLLLLSKGQNSYFSVLHTFREWFDNPVSSVVINNDNNRSNSRNNSRAKPLNISDEFRP